MDTSFSHLILGLPLRLVAYSFPYSIFFGIAEGFVTVIFYRVRLLASRPTPNLEDQDIPFCLGHHLRPVQQGWHYQ